MESAVHIRPSSDTASQPKKRRIDVLYDPSEPNHPAQPPPVDHTPRSKNNEQQPSKVLIVHSVDCAAADSHSEHSETAYFDCPGLFSGDHKASALRGKRRIDDVDEYIEQHEELYMVVYREYSCEEYHESVQDLFQRLQLPHQNVTIGSRIRPYLFCLKDDTREAPWGSEELRVLSGTLRKVLSSFGCPENMTAPYLPLYHQREPIAEYLRNATGEEHQALSVLMEYVHENFDAEYAEADTLFSQRRVSLKHFSKMFRPDEVVVATSPDQPQAFVSNMIPGSLPNSIRLDCWGWAFDGTFKRKNTMLSVEWPAKVADVLYIHDLDVYPLRFDDTGIQDLLRSRGNVFWSFRIRKYVSYISGHFTFEEQTASPRYMIDMHTYYEMHPNEAAADAQDGQGVLPELVHGDEIPEDPFPLLLPPTVRGYGFHDKKWRDLVVDNIEDVSWNSTAFDRLVLSPQKKKIIEALVTVHVATSSASTDIIEGKGNGLIMLLHGSPGTGKTLTAESIAELTQKPLYRVTCGDIGTEPEAVEKYLESVLFIGTIWGCVVLLDEADVFLEERTQNDLQRNALVSVFLRVLEYYEGILILTSNRVGTFDEAFKSRIQLAIHYPRLERQDRAKIWNGFIGDLDEKTTEVDRLRDNIPNLAQHDLNGRQIRNMVKSARQLAYYEHQNLGYEQLEAVIDVSNEFEKYLEKLHGHKDSDWAKDLGIRAD